MKEISDSLGMVPLPENEVTTLTKVPASDSKVENADKDYEYARENFYNVIEKGTYALEEMLEVAKASEHPRAYEVVSTIMKTLVDANKDLVTMSDKKVKDAPQEEPPSTPPCDTSTTRLFHRSCVRLRASSNMPSFHIHTSSP